MNGGCGDAPSGTVKFGQRTEVELTAWVDWVGEAAQFGGGIFMPLW